MAKQPILRLSFSAMASPVWVQLSTLGLETERADHFEASRLAVIRLHVLGYLTDAEKAKVATRLVAEIARTVKPLAQPAEVA